MLISRLKLGEILLKEGLITEEQLENALQIQKKEGVEIKEALLKLGVVTEGAIASCLGKQLGIPYASLTGGDEGSLKPAKEQGLEELVPEYFARGNLILPISRNLNSLTCALVDPFDLMTIDNLKKLTGCEINPVIVTKSDMEKALDSFYGKEDFLKEAVSKSQDLYTGIEVAEEKEEDLSLDKIIAKAEEAPIVRLVDLIIRQGIRERASDIHIEPFKGKISLRYRVDGKLYETPPPAKHLMLPIVSRIKILAKLDIAEKRLPQDGAFLVKVEGRPIDLRVSTVPTIYGEKVVMRILDKSLVPLDLEKLGFDSEALSAFRKAINSPYGLVFLTGPTGSGKTTTLYAALNEIKSPQDNILTIEDPVEFRLDGINQVQIKPEIGLNFATGLRSFLRQDPDIIMVGEVRDLETAEICIRAALTGHLVLSTLHTNDAPSAISRLIDIGAEAYLVAPSLLVVCAQRLMRRLCPECKEPYEPPKDIIESYRISPKLLYRPRGCERCSQTGYVGRVGIYEVMAVDDSLRALISKSATYQEFQEAAKQAGMKTLLDCALKKVEEGVSSLEEALSVTAMGG